MLDNNLYFFRHNWSGLLVEPLPEAFDALRKRNRNAYLLPHCLSTKTTPEIVDFEASGLVGGIIYKSENEVRTPTLGEKKEFLKSMFGLVSRTIQVQCFPLYSVLLAMGNPTIDYMSLDIEGGEIPVLKTIPWSKTNIKVVAIEANHVGAIFPGTLSELRKIMKDNGYHFVETVEIDEVYVKRELLLPPKDKKLV